MAAARPAQFKKSDGTAYVTPNVRAAFWDEGIAVIEVEALQGAPPQPPPPPPLSEPEVNEMLVADAEWKLAVAIGTDTEVLTKADLITQLESPPAGTAEVKLRPISPSEKLLVEATSKLFAPDVSYDRLKESLSLPVAQAALVATGAGLFGLLALRDDISHPNAMKAAVIVASIAVATSLVGRYWLREVTVKPARLDLLKQRFEESIRGPLWRSRVGIFLLLCAIALALISTWPAKEAASPAATITGPTVTQTSEGTSVHLKVTWKNLGDTVAKVRTVVQTGEGVPITQTSPKGNDGTAEDELQFKLKAPATIDVTTTPLDSGGAPVGPGTSQELKVP